VLGSAHMGTCFDVCVIEDDGEYRMYFSWRSRQSVAVAESADGVHWGEPVIALAPRVQTGWEEEINRPSVLKKDGRYMMWYTGQERPGAADGFSRIGFASGVDGLRWDRLERPVLEFGRPWEKRAVMCPHVLWDERERLFKMWYSGGEQYEPDAIGYATSPDGLSWAKHPANPVFRADPASSWEKHKVTACQVVEHYGWYLMFYIGFEDVDTARIGVARSKDGVGGWERLKSNPILSPGAGKWDADACYKPYALCERGGWTLWYNGRRGSVEQIGMARHEGDDLGF